MTGSIITGVFYAVIASSLLFGLINLFRSNFYDLRQARLWRELARHPNARYLRRRPLISVIVFAYNDAATITACLKSIANGSYRKTEIIVIDNSSRDATKSLAREFIKANPKRSLRLVARRKHTDRAETIAASAKWAKGELMMVIDAGCLLDKQALRSTALMMAAQPSTDAVLANTQVEHNYRLFGLADKLRAIATVWAKKAGDIIGPALDPYNYAATYRRKTFQKIIKPKNRQSLDDINRLRALTQGLTYDSRTLVKAYKTQSALPSIRVGSTKKLVRTLAGLRNLLALLEPLVVCFMIYVAIRFDSTGYILLAWLAFTSLLLLAIWSDDSRGSLPKIRLSLFALVAYTLYLLQALVSYAKLAALVLYRTINRAISNSAASLT